MAKPTAHPVLWELYFWITFLTLEYTEGASSAYEALDTLRGRTPFNPAELKMLMRDAQPGVAYPTLSTIPQTSFSCNSVQQAGFYPDPETQCQVYHRCEPDAPMTSYLCPNGTLFSPVILVCDYWYNVQCSRSKQFENFSNPKIYAGKNVRLLDDGNSSSTALPNSQGSQGSFTSANQQSSPTMSITLRQSPPSNSHGGHKSHPLQHGKTSTEPLATSTTSSKNGTSTTTLKS